MTDREYLRAMYSLPPRSERLIKALALDDPDERDWQVRAIWYELSAGEQKHLAKILDKAGYSLSI